MRSVFKVSSDLHLLIGSSNKGATSVRSKFLTLSSVLMQSSVPITILHSALVFWPPGGAPGKEESIFPACGETELSGLIMVLSR